MSDRNAFIEILAIATTARTANTPPDKELLEMIARIATRHVKG